jgi:polysaccharide export outer membrane protein
MRSGIAAWLGVTLSLWTCFTSGSPARAADPAPILAPLTVAQLAQSYRLGPGDHVRVTVFNEPTLSGEFGVTDSGRISLPLIGDVTAAGMTITEFQQLATKTFADGYLNNPRLSVEIITYRPFYILGEVMKPGEYPYEVGLTVMKAVAAANGFTYRGNTKSIWIKHDGEQEREVKLDSNTPVLPGDTIRIKERMF